jgi:gamma-glutamylcyclotransferase
MIGRLKRALRRRVARPWHLSKVWYRLYGLSIQGRPGDEVWYFAFGANMHDSAFRERRRMRPREWRPGRVKGYRLRFNLEGRPRGRAAPANIAPDPAAEVCGVLYRITRKDLVWLDCTEGVPGRRYRQIPIEAEDGDGNPFAAVTYIAEGRATDGRPSLRYITLLRDGARAHDLPEHWLRFLDGLRHAEWRRDPPRPPASHRRRTASPARERSSRWRSRSARHSG